MYAFAALLLLATWYFLSQVHNVTGGLPYMLLAGSLLAIAMHVLRRAEPA
jgi:hypothetical protein